MQAAFISPYLSTLGGGEKYLLDIARALHELDYEIVFYWPDKNIKNDIIERFGEAYQFIRVDTSWQRKNPLSRLLETKNYDCIFYHPDGSYFFSLARRNFALLQVPSSVLLGSQNIINRLKLRSFVPVFNSLFTKRYFMKLIAPQRSHVLYPTISDELFKLHEKRNLILSVGRFFSHLHAKKQEVLINAFQRACHDYVQFRSYKLVLMGSYKKEDEPYLKELKKRARTQSNIEIITNAAHGELLRLYGRARFYWHAAGYGENDTDHPERMEHFGISIVEAMAAGAVPFAYKGGGPKETIDDGKTGYLYHTRGELIKKTLQLIKDETKTSAMMERSRLRAEKKFSYRAFKKHIQELLQ